MQKKRVIRDKKIKTMNVMGSPHYETVEGKRRLIYNRKYGIAIMKHPEKEKYGLVNMWNEVLVDTKYDFCCYPKFGIAFVQKKGLWGFVNCRGDLICDCNYTHIYSFKKKIALVRRGDQYGLVGINGNVVLKCKYTREQALYERRVILHRM